MKPYPGESPSPRSPHQFVRKLSQLGLALGRVVVYRNGIAYYERQARVEGDTLTLDVPHDKVDDFLKSLSCAFTDWSSICVA